MGIVVKLPRADCATVRDPAERVLLRADLAEALRRFELAVGFLRRLPIRPESLLLAFLIGRLERTLGRLDAALVVAQPDLAELQALCAETTELLPLFAYLKQDLLPTGAAAGSGAAEA